jgi:hypothetical protein
LEESSRLYWELARRGAYAQGEKRRWKYDSRPLSPLSEEELHTLALLQARYDPRLMAVLVDYFQKVSDALDPLRFKRLLREAGASPVAAVIGEYVRGDLFDFLRIGVLPVPTQLFYKGLYPLGGRKIEETLSRSLRAFKKWGFLAADPPLLKERTGKRSREYDREARLRILREFARERGTFRLRDYLQEVRFSVSRQQALKDLASVSWIRKIGRGKGRVYESF